MFKHYRIRKIFLILLVITPFSLSAKQTLQQVHILFRHGDRTTDSHIYPNDPYKNETFYPTGRGELTIKGKHRAYTLGKYLRGRYLSFLGRVYTPDIVEACSSDRNRTKTTLELVLAGLFPPAREQVWESDLNWQPIPFQSLSKDIDNIFFGFTCPSFSKLFEEAAERQRRKPFFKVHEETIAYISTFSGLEIKSSFDLYLLCLCLKTEKENGLQLPSWTQRVFPQPLVQFIHQAYVLITATTEMKKYVSGALLKKIIDDSKAKLNNKMPQKKRKIYLYSGHDINLAGLLRTLGVYDLGDHYMPPYASFVALELHKIGNVAGFKVLYYDYTSALPKLLKIPGCKKFCPLHHFTFLMHKYIPEKDFYEKK